MLFAKAGDRARTRADKSAQSALKTVMKTVQSLAKEQQLVINTMQSEHDTPEVLEALLEIDHANSQLSRRAQAIAVLCGSWAGQQRSPATLTDVVRGATSRIRNYLRVQVHDQVDTAVASWAVEPVVLALAELLDNAARYSPPTTTIEVNFQKAHHGIGVMVDDAGVGMDPDARQRAADTLSGGRRAVDITALGDPPQIGFAVVGVLAARYGFTVSVDTVSPHGGVRAVLFLPTELLTELPASETVPTAAAPDTSDADDLSTQERRAGYPSAVPDRSPRRPRRRPHRRPRRRPHRRGRRSRPRRNGGPHRRHEVLPASARGNVVADPAVRQARRTRKRSDRHERLRRQQAGLDARRRPENAGDAPRDPVLRRRSAQGSLPADRSGRRGAARRRDVRVTVTGPRDRRVLR